MLHFPFLYSKLLPEINLHLPTDIQRNKYSYSGKLSLCLAECQHKCLIQGLDEKS